MSRFVCVRVSQVRSAISNQERSLNVKDGRSSGFSTAPPSGESHRGVAQYGAAESLCCGSDPGPRFSPTSEALIDVDALFPPEAIGGVRKEKGMQRKKVVTGDQLLNKVRNCRETRVF